MKYLQKLGKSLMIPVAALPVCGILMGIGYLLCPGAMQGGEISGFLPTFGYIMVKAGSAIIDNISWLFVIGVSMGMSDENSVESALAGLVSWLMIITLLNPKIVAMISPSVTEDTVAMIAFEKIQNTFIAIIAGIIGSTCYNRFRKVELPVYLSFFSGRRFVIIVSALLSVLVTIVLSFVWPVAFKGLAWLGTVIQKSGPIGVGIYAFLNRLLIPFGLHHALNNIFWFDTIGIGDLTAYWAGKTSADVGWSLGMYMSGFFAPTMFGIVGAALAMIRCAGDKKAAKKLLLPSAICANISGVTEPFEFGFMFTCFPLYIVYCVLFGIFAVITYYSGFRGGFAFSAGLTDLIFSASFPAAQKTWMILPLGALAFAVFYIVFRICIQKFDLKTPGREDTAAVGTVLTGRGICDAPETPGKSEDCENAGKVSCGNHKYTAMADALITAMGGKDNIRSVACCATRLRTELNDTGIVDQNAVKAAGAIACVIIDRTNCQIIIGTTVQQLCDEINRILGEMPECAAEEKASRQSGTQPEENTSRQSETQPEENTSRQSEKQPEGIEGPKVHHGEKIPSGIIRMDGTELPQENGSQTAPLLSDNAAESQKETLLTYTVTGETGIHARPASGIAAIQKKHSCKISMEAEGKTADASSIIEILSLGAVRGTELIIRISGADSRETAAELENYLKKNL